MFTSQRASQALKPDPPQPAESATEFSRTQAKSTHGTPEDAQLAMTLLEADQLVAAKRSSRFGRRTLTLRERLLFWSLRIYVVIMLLIVLLSVLQAVHRAH